MKALEDVFEKYLSNVTLRHEVLKLAEEIKVESVHVRGDITSIRSSVGNVTLDSLLNVIKKSELYR